MSAAVDESLYVDCGKGEAPGLTKAKPIHVDREPRRSTMARQVAFDTTVAASGNNTGIVIPDELIEKLGAGRRPQVKVSVNGYEYRYTVGVMARKHMIGISAAIRRETGLQAGDPIHVTLELAEGPREVHVPEDFASALARDKNAGAFFAALSNSLQRYHVDNINGAKTPETRQRRIDKAVSLFQQGKKR
jgi:hypothetical protein